MNKASSYITSLIVSSLLVFAIIASSALLLVDINLSASNLKSLSQKKILNPKYMPKSRNITPTSTIQQEFPPKYTWIQ